ncbi:hypothetical protein BH09PAT1_BH09PAT1_3930 [soil metagenome]
MNKMIFLKKIKHAFFQFSLHSKQTIRKVLNKPLIITFGDSHSLNLQEEHFVIHHVGPATAYNLVAEHSTTKSNQKIKKVLGTLVPQGKHFFLFIFGEIDCRIHIYSISKSKSRSLEDVVSGTIDRYGKFLCDVKKKFPKSKILVMNVLPPGEEGNIYGVRHYPTREIHMKIVNVFNKDLDAFCKQKGMIYIDVFSHLIESDGTRKRGYFFDNTHFNNKIIPFILSEIRSKTNNFL